MSTKLNESEIKPYFYEVLLAIAHLHAKGIVHRDIKPENFILYGDKKKFLLKLVDFGLAK